MGVDFLVSTQIESIFSYKTDPNEILDLQFCDQKSNT